MIDMNVLANPYLVTKPTVCLKISSIAHHYMIQHELHTKQPKKWRSLIVAAILCLGAQFSGENPPFSSLMACSVAHGFIPCRE